MKKTITLCVTITLLFASCQSKKNQNVTENVDEIGVEKKNESPKTYAEISIKEGGHWEGKKYVGGKFKNVDVLKLPKEHTDHSTYLRYEGPGWENDKIAYRLYLDWRNAIDIFGKTTDSMVLSHVGLENLESYHEMNTWGMDILKVGNSLGIGSIGRFADDRVYHFEKVDSTTVSINNAADVSSVKIDYYGWEPGNAKVNLASEFSIYPGNRYVKHTFQSSDALSNLCTGIVKFENIPLHRGTSNSGNWTYIATYGVQTLVPDQLGMAIFYKTSEVETTLDGKDDHLVVFKASPAPVSYYFLGAWEKEPDGIKTEEDFLKYLNEVLASLDKTS